MHERSEKFLQSRWSVGITFGVRTCLTSNASQGHQKLRFQADQEVSSWLVNTRNNKISDIRESGPKADTILLLYLCNTLCEFSLEKPTIPPFWPTFCNSCLAMMEKPCYCWQLQRDKLKSNKTCTICAQKLKTAWPVICHYRLGSSLDRNTDRR